MTIRTVTYDDLKPCPCCGGVAAIIKGMATGGSWEHGEFHRVYCTKCQLRQLFYKTPGDATEAWNIRHELICSGR